MPADSLLVANRYILCYDGAMYLRRRKGA